jgi:hypothetical protein
MGESRLNELRKMFRTPRYVCEDDRAIAVLTGSQEWKDRSAFKISFHRVIPACGSALRWGRPPGIDATDPGSLTVAGIEELVSHDRHLDLSFGMNDPFMTGDVIRFELPPRWAEVLVRGQAQIGCLSFRHCLLPDETLRLLLTLNLEDHLWVHLVDTEVPEWWLSEMHSRPYCFVEYVPPR